MHWAGELKHIDLLQSATQSLQCRPMASSIYSELIAYGMHDWPAFKGQYRKADISDDSNRLSITLQLTNCMPMKAGISMLVRLKR